MSTLSAVPVVDASDDVGHVAIDSVEENATAAATTTPAPHKGSRHGKHRRYKHRHKSTNTQDELEREHQRVATDLQRNVDALRPEMEAIMETMRHSELICTNVISGDVFANADTFRVRERLSDIVLVVDMLPPSLVAIDGDSNTITNTRTSTEVPEVHKDLDNSVIYGEVETSETAACKNVSRRDDDVSGVEESMERHPPESVEAVTPEPLLGHDGADDDNVIVPSKLRQLWINLERAQAPWSPLNDDGNLLQSFVHKTALDNGVEHPQQAPYGVQHILMSEATVLIHMQRAIYAKRTEAYTQIAEALEYLLEPHASFISSTAPLRQQPAPTAKDEHGGDSIKSAEAEAEAQNETPTQEREEAKDGHAKRKTHPQKHHTAQTPRTISQRRLDTVRASLVDAHAVLIQYARLPFAQLFALNTGRLPMHLPRRLGSKSATTLGRATQFRLPREGGHPSYNKIKSKHLKNLGQPIVGLVMQKVKWDLGAWMRNDVLTMGAMIEQMYDATHVLSEMSHSVMDACRIVHSMHVVHGDIKMHNIGVGASVVTPTCSSSQRHAWFDCDKPMSINEGNVSCGESLTCVKFIDFGTAFVHHPSVDALSVARRDYAFSGEGRGVENKESDTQYDGEEEEGDKDGEYQQPLVDGVAIVNEDVHPSESGIIQPLGRNLVSPLVLRAMRCTQNWRAPEMLLSRRYVPLDPYAIDIYATGLVCMALVTRNTHIQTLDDPDDQSAEFVTARALLTGGIGNGVVMKCDKAWTLNGDAGVLWYGDDDDGDDGEDDGEITDHDSVGSMSSSSHQPFDIASSTSDENADEEEEECDTTESSPPILIGDKYMHRLRRYQEVLENDVLGTCPMNAKLIERKRRYYIRNAVIFGSNDDEEDDDHDEDEECEEDEEDEECDEEEEYEEDEESDDDWERDGHLADGTPWFTDRYLKPRIIFDYLRPDAQLLDAANLWRNQPCAPCSVDKGHVRNDDAFCLPCYATNQTDIRVNVCRPTHVTNNVESSSDDNNNNNNNNHNINTESVNNTALAMMDAYDPGRFHPMFEILNFANSAHLHGFNMTRAILAPDDVLATNDQRRALYAHVTTPSVAARLSRDDCLQVSHIAIAIRSVALAQMSTYVAVCIGDPKLLDAAKRAFVVHTIHGRLPPSEFLPDCLGDIAGIDLDPTVDNIWMANSDGIYPDGSIIPLNWCLDPREIIDVFSTVGWMAYLQAIARAIREMRHNLIPKLALVSADMAMRSEFNPPTDVINNIGFGSGITDRDRTRMQADYLRQKVHNHCALAWEEVACYESVLGRIAECLWLNPNDRKWTTRADYQHTHLSEVDGIGSDTRFGFGSATNDDEDEERNPNLMAGRSGDLARARAQMVQRQSQIIRHTIHTLDTRLRHIPGVFTQTLPCNTPQTIGRSNKADFRTLYRHASQPLGLDYTDGITSAILPGVIPASNDADKTDTRDDSQSAVVADDDRKHIAQLIRAINTSTDLKDILTYNNHTTRPKSSLEASDDIFCRHVVQVGCDVQQRIFDIWQTLFEKTLPNDNDIGDPSEKDDTGEKDDTDTDTSAHAEEAAALRQKFADESAYVKRYLATDVWSTTGSGIVDDIDGNHPINQYMAHRRGHHGCWYVAIANWLQYRGIFFASFVPTPSADHHLLQPLARLIIDVTIIINFFDMACQAVGITDCVGRLRVPVALSIIGHYIAESGPKSRGESIEQTKVADDDERRRWYAACQQVERMLFTLWGDILPPSMSFASKQSDDESKVGLVQDGPDPDGCVGDPAMIVSQWIRRQLGSRLYQHMFAHHFTTMTPATTAIARNTKLINVATRYAGHGGVHQTLVNYLLLTTQSPGHKETLADNAEFYTPLLKTHPEIRYTPLLMHETGLHALLWVEMFSLITESVPTTPHEDIWQFVGFVLGPDAMRTKPVRRMIRYMAEIDNFAQRDSQSSAELPNGGDGDDHEDDVDGGDGLTLLAKDVDDVTATATSTTEAEAQAQAQDDAAATTGTEAQDDATATATTEAEAEAQDDATTTTETSTTKRPTCQTSYPESRIITLRPTAD